MSRLQLITHFNMIQLVAGDTIIDVFVIFSGTDKLYII